MQLTGIRLLEVCQALNTLRYKRLPTLDADLLVASLWIDLKNAVEEHDVVAAKLSGELQETSDPEARRALLKRFEELSVRLFQVPPPRRKLTKDDLPRPYAGEAGEMNTAGNAGVITGLGAEYFQLDF